MKIVFLFVVFLIQWASTQQNITDEIVVEPVGEKLNLDRKASCVPCMLAAKFFSSITNSTAGRSASVNLCTIVAPSSSKARCEPMIESAAFFLRDSQPSVICSDLGICVGSLADEEAVMKQQTELASLVVEDALKIFDDDIVPTKSKRVNLGLRKSIKKRLKRIWNSHAAKLVREVVKVVGVIVGIEG